MGHQRRDSHGRYRASPHLDDALFDPSIGRQIVCNLNVPPPPSTFFNAVPEFVNNGFSYVPKCIMNSVSIVREESVHNFKQMSYAKSLEC
jgi:hypothetical protein